ncbi:hypothetical protein GOV05_03880 [Candidatus Woesearchaeota archaeon]|nr:hypothetical protein [Candidatus Woesearchaeota archaeon]
MMESLGVVFVFFMLLSLALIFYGAFQKDKITELRGEKTDLDIVSLSQTITSLPELKCSEQNSIDENCYDLLNIQILSHYMNDSDGFLSPNNVRTRVFYTQLFKNSNITINVYDEKNNNFTTYPVYYNNDDNKSSTRNNLLPITIKDSRNGEFYFGILNLAIFTD